MDMPRDGQLRDERGLSESAGVAILVGVTIVVTASVGLNVLVVSEQDTGPPSANFSYEYIDASSALLVTHSRGDEFTAGKLYLATEQNEETWAALAGANESKQVGPGDLVQLSDNNAFGQRITASTRVEIFYEYGDERRKLDEWPN